MKLNSVALRLDGVSDETEKMRKRLTRWMRDSCSGSRNGEYREELHGWYELFHSSRN